MTTMTWQDDTDAALDDAAHRYARERYEFSARLRLSTAERRFNAAAWRDMAEMGWLSVATPEAHGGFGVRAASIALLSETAGRSLINEPLIGMGILAPFVVAHHASGAQREMLLPPMLAGELRVACVLGDGNFRVSEGRLSGRCEVVLDADIAARFLIEAAGTLWLVEAEAPGVTVASYPLLDGRGAATVTLEHASCTSLGSSDASAVHMATALHLAALATAADSLGAMRAAFELTLEHLKTRRQFGAPLGVNQSLQHRAVDIYVRIAESRAVVNQAVASVQAESPYAARDAHAAKSFVCESARQALQDAVQLSGGIGITEEYAISHYLRRVRVNEQLHGSAEEHLRAFALAPSSFH